MTAVAKLFLLSNIVAFGTVGYTGELEEMRCKYLLAIVDNCWYKYTSLPTCNKVYDPLVNCANDQRYAAENMNCDIDIQETLKITWTIYITMRETLCSDSKLYEEFQEKSPCWTTVRECAPNFASTPAQEGLHSYKCSEMFGNMQECFQNTTFMCTNVLKRFANVMALRTPCRQHMDIEMLEDDNSSLCHHSSIFHVYFAITVLALAVITWW